MFYMLVYLLALLLRTRLAMNEEAALTMLTTAAEMANTTTTADGEVTADPTTKTSCSEMSDVYNRAASSVTGGVRVVNTSRVPSRALDIGDRLKVCTGTTNTCCTEEMETAMVEASKVDFRKLVEDKIVGLSHIFKTRTTNFDRFFREMLVNSRRDLHQMFRRTYGIFYDQNSGIFASLFDQLSAYYTNGDIDLEMTMDVFYQTLYRRMFQILNQPYHFDSVYLDCINKHMEQLQPFGDVPRKMKEQVLRAFRAARSFVRGLAAGQDAIEKIMQLSPSAECSIRLTQMYYCSTCQGFYKATPCSSFCADVITECLASQIAFDQHWNNYLEALSHLIKLLEGPYNIESLVDPIDIKISDAIMIFQDKGKELSDRVFLDCGRPLPLRMKRRRRSSEDIVTMSFENLKFDDLKASDSQVSNTAGANLERLTKDIREKVLPAKGFWKNLPRSICFDPDVLHTTDEMCWNGNSMERSLPNDTFNHTFFHYLTSKIDPVIEEQIKAIKQAALNLRKSFDEDQTFPRKGIQEMYDNYGIMNSKTRDTGDQTGVDGAQFSLFDGSGDLMPGGDYSSLSKSDLDSRVHLSKLKEIQTDDEDLVKSIVQSQEGSAIAVDVEATVSLLASGDSPIDEIYSERLNAETVIPVLHGVHSDNVGGVGNDVHGLPPSGFFGAAGALTTLQPFVFRIVATEKDHDVFDRTTERPSGSAASTGHFVVYAFTFCLVSVLFNVFSNHLLLLLQLAV